MEIAEAIDSVSREKLFIDGDHYNGQSSSTSSNSLLLRRSGSSSKAQRPDRASPLYLICLTIGTGG